MLAVVLEGRSEVRIGSKIAKSGIITFDETPFFSGPFIDHSIQLIIRGIVPVHHPKCTYDSK